MDNDEAIRLLEEELAVLRGESYEALAARIDDDVIVRERTGRGATAYQIEIQVVWDGPKGGNVRVIGSVDDGGWRAFVPVTRSFSKAPSGQFVGE
jgi:hypothetical protein